MIIIIDGLLVFTIVGGVYVVGLAAWALVWMPNILSRALASNDPRWEEMVNDYEFGCRNAMPWHWLRTWQKYRNTTGG